MLPSDRPCLSLLVALLLCVGVFFESLKNIFVQQWTYGIENGAVLQSLQGADGKKVLATVDPVAQRARKRAAAYYEEQRPLFEAAAKRFYLNQYFVDAARNFSGHDSSFYDLVEKRLHAMAALHKQNAAADDFRIEKDKCAMTNFFVRNQLPTPPLLRHWDDRESLLAELRSGAAVAKVAQWPVFLKFCHLTQGSAHSVRPVPSAKWLRDNLAEVEAWINHLWTFTANDWTRPWYASSNALTAAMVPGVLMQGPATLSKDYGSGKSYAVEAKVEVLWGRAYLAIVSPEGLDHVEPIVTRPGGNFTAEVYDNYLDLVTLHGHGLRKDAWYNWIIDEGHMQCVWALGERAAALMGIDEVRIDIFITRGDPDGCAINEDSISSGHPYGAHGPFLTKLWFEPHKRKWYRPYASKVRVYEQTAANHPAFEAAESERKAHHHEQNHRDGAKDAAASSSPSPPRRLVVLPGTLPQPAEQYNQAGAAPAGVGKKKNKS